MDHNTEKNSGHVLKTFFQLLGRFRFECGGLLFITALLGATEGIVHPLLIKSIFDEVVTRGSFKRFVFLIVGYLGLGLVMNFGSTAVALWSKSLENRLVKIVNRRLLEALR